MGVPGKRSRSGSEAPPIGTVVDWTGGAVADAKGIARKEDEVLGVGLERRELFGAEGFARYRLKCRFIDIPKHN